MTTELTTERTPEQMQRAAIEHGERCDSLWSDLRERLGNEWYLGHGGVEFILTPTGRSAIRAAGITFFRHDETGEPIAGRNRGGRAEFAIVEPSGRMIWTLTPAGDPNAN